MLRALVSIRNGSMRKPNILTRSASTLSPTDDFAPRHIGPSDSEVDEMLKVVGATSLDGLIDKTVPSQIRLKKPMVMEPARSENEALIHIRKIIEKNILKRSFIGMGYHETILPHVILRNLFENPGWYTSYTPYQGEIAQGRLEMLLNFQTMVADLTGMEMANASLLDESTAAAEAMSMCFALTKGKRHKFFVSDRCHPQTIGLVQTRADPLHIEVVVGDVHTASIDDSFAGVLVQYPDTYGAVHGFKDVVTKTHEAGALVVCATDLLALTQLESPGDWGADIAVGSAQRFGVPMGFGGPHAGFCATSEKYARRMPGRVIGVTIDTTGRPALRMAMQTREQHIRRDKATSNICTAQALLAIMAAGYGIYHGPKGLQRISSRVHSLATVTKSLLDEHGFETSSDPFFDAFTVTGVDSEEIQRLAFINCCNVRIIDEETVGLSFGEGHFTVDVVGLLKAFGIDTTEESLESAAVALPENYGEFGRATEFMTHPIFNTMQSESQMLRYLKKLETKDLSLNHSMIPLGSCTMKLNATSEMRPISWPKTTNIHPFAPADQTLGYQQLISDLNKDLATITGFAAVSSQPNSGANGEFTGLLCIKAWQEARGQGNRNICLIPVSAHGTNPASATMAGLKVVTVKTMENGDIDFEDLKEKVEKHTDNLAALMATYPSTYGVFEERIMEICDLIHDHGGQVYMDGANMNAQVGLTSPGFIGADVCHLNLHKTFCIPHGGGGPGVGSIGVAEHLAPFLPGHAVVPTGGDGLNTMTKTNRAVAAAPFGSALILPISWMYIKMLGEPGLKNATQVAILNANYMAKRLEFHYKILFRGSTGMCAHEFIMDIRPFKKCGVTEEDVCKRLQDYGFHGPTMSWPVTGTLMIEPTESEDKAELDRFIDALISIREEIREIEEGRMAYVDSPLHLSPHTANVVMAEEWDRPYSRQVAAFPAPWQKNGATFKFWPTVSRIDNVYGDRNLVCSCPPLSIYEEENIIAP
mmetsp:Transcript_21015/g.24841  ORF Transcript_21015/g.24841 Transcript_21015/m.24841 type:complete len:988 (-) Transcript_21015:297-3260(-)